MVELLEKEQELYKLFKEKVINIINKEKEAVPLLCFNYNEIEKSIFSPIMVGKNVELNFIVEAYKEKLIEEIGSLPDTIFHSCEARSLEIKVSDLSYEERKRIHKMTNDELKEEFGFKDILLFTIETKESIKIEEYDIIRTSNEEELVLSSNPISVKNFSKNDEKYLVKSNIPFFLND